MPQAAPSSHVRLIREHDRARYDRETIDSILVAHLGFTVGEQPFVIPTLHARVGDRVYVHGSPRAGRCGPSTAASGPVSR
jgi:nitroimidazol reductase NimA-like FMN-containing flavoprotein (pyridoxamine 5'-phosphate oxidase superfamily)